MAMTYCYRYERGAFVEATSPLDTKTGSFDAAGYFPQLQAPDSSSAVATVYQHMNGDNGMPHFLIDLWGEESQIALLVADDLNQLLATLKAVKPMTRCSVTQ